MTMSLETIAKKMEEVETYRTIGIVEVETTPTNNSTIIDPIAISKLQDDITELFKDLEIPANVKGFEYLRYAITLKYLYPEKYLSLSKELYPEIAKYYSTTCARVERACRHAIEVGYDRGNLERYDEIFGHTLNSDKGKPVNSVFIMTITEYINYSKSHNYHKSLDECETVIEESVTNTENLMKEITDLLKDLGVPANIKGFEYLRCAIFLKYLYPEKFFGAIKELYPEIAKRYSTTGTRVERACRHAIEVGYGRGNLERYDEIFGYTINSNKKKPTCSEFIATLVDYISRSKRKWNPKSQPKNEKVDDELMLIKERLMNEIADLLKVLRIPANIKGFEYIRYAISIKCLHPEKYLSLGKELYPEIAKYYSTTSARVERACRHAIKVGYSRGNVEQYYKFFGKTLGNKQPKNSRFFATVSDYIIRKTSI